MRLSQSIYSSIKNRIQQSIPDADVFLFGSRVDDFGKGGDIDLLLLTDERLPLVFMNRINWGNWGYWTNMSDWTPGVYGSDWTDV